QVVGRLGYGLLHRHTHTRSRTVAIVFAVAATTALLGLFTSTVALVAAVLAAGMARGLFTLLQATAVPDRWGAAHVGRLMGLLVAPLTVATALGPWVGVGLAEVTGGHPQAFLILAALAAAAVAAAAASAPRQPPKPEHPTHCRDTNERRARHRRRPARAHRRTYSSSPRLAAARSRSRARSRRGLARLLRQPHRVLAG